MCLPMAVKRPQDVVAKGEHEGFEWNIVHNTMGYLCGYVKVGKDHPWYGKGYDFPDVTCHGGLTFADYDKPCDAPGPDDGYWVGFDCAHAGDAPQEKYITGEHRTTRIESMLHNSGVVRDEDYVRAECQSICEQALAAVK